MKLTKGQIIFGVGSALVVTGVVYFGFIKKMENGLTWYQGIIAGKEGGAIGGNTTETSKINFEKLAANIGIPAPTSDVLNLNFNNGKNKAQFYKNNRVALSKIDTTGILTLIGKGTYSNGGLTILLDKDGSQITTSSVFTTLQNAVK